MRVVVTFEHEATSRAPEGTFVVRDGKRIRPVGLEIEGPDVWKLVANGLADPADDECESMFTPEQVAYAKEVGHPALVRRHAEAVQEARDNASIAEIVETEGDD